MKRCDSGRSGQFEAHHRMTGVRSERPRTSSTAEIARACAGHRDRDVQIPKQEPPTENLGGNGKPFWREGYAGSTRLG